MSCMHAPSAYSHCLSRGQIIKAREGLGNENDSHGDYVKWDWDLVCVRVAS